ncbi:MAG: DUF4388 domain-containing protein [Myxococcota bacterium]
MALKGILAGLGCADVFQLMGQGNKTGLLKLRSQRAAVDIWFQNGNVVRVEDMSRDPRHRLGELLVRAGLISREMLTDALAVQRRTRRRLGEVLVEGSYISAPTLKEFTRLQTTETLYNAFLWRRGTYEFVPDVRTMPDPDLGRGIRWDQALMEGVRRAGDWPAIRKVVPSNEHTFRVVKELEAEAPPPEEPAEDDFSFGDVDGEGGGGSKPRLGPNEHLVYALIRPGITVQRIVDRSYLGEYETCRALWQLAEQGYIEAVIEEVELGDLDAVEDVDTTAEAPMPGGGSDGGKG